MRRQAAKDELADQLTRSQVAENLAKAGGTGGYAARALPVKRGLQARGGSLGPWSGQGGKGGAVQSQEQEQPLGSEPVRSIDELNKRVAAQTGQKDTIPFITSNIAGTTFDAGTNTYT